MELRACLSPAPRGPPDRYHRKKRSLPTSVPPPASLTEMTCTNDGVDDGSQRELTTKPRLAEGAASARDASTARQNRRNRQIYPALHMSSRAPTHEKWRPTRDLARQTPRAAARLRERKVWQTRVLQSSTVGSEHGKMALLAFEKAPFSAIFRHFFVDFPRVFSTSLFVMALWGQIRPRNALADSEPGCLGGFTTRYNDRSSGANASLVRVPFVLFVRFVVIQSGCSASPIATATHDGEPRRTRTASPAPTLFPQSVVR